MQNTTNSLLVTELNHIAVYVRDLEHCAHFYGQVLGLSELASPDFGFSVRWFSIGNQEIHLIHDPNRRSEGRAFHFALRVNDANAASVALRDLGVSDLRGPAPRPDGAIQVFFNDPEGNEIEMVSFAQP